jgi:hypothetical protein
MINLKKDFKNIINIFQNIYNKMGLKENRQNSRVKSDSKF